MSGASKWCGQCACGKIRYESTEAPTFSFHCQCRDCQRASGTGHSSAFVVAKETTSTTGEPRFFDQTSDRGTVVSRGFCPDCGSPMWNRNSAFPDRYYVNAATLDDPSVFQPTAVVFAESAQQWDFLDPALE